MTFLNRIIHVSKIFLIFITLAFWGSIFTGTAFADACCCGDRCPHSPLSEAEEKNGFPNHKHCPEGHCNSCDIERGLTYEVVKPTGPDISVYTYSIIALSFFFNSHLSVAMSAEFYQLRDFQVANRFTPIFLQNLSFIC